MPANAVDLIKGRCLIDTNVLIYATLRGDPRHAIAVNVLERARAGRFSAFVSVQNVAEMYPNLTGPKQKPPDPPELARRKIASLAGLPYLTVLPIDEAVLLKAIYLCDRHAVRKQDYFDMQIVATMLVNGIERIVTENASDFTKVREIEVVDPFGPA